MTSRGTDLLKLEDVSIRFGSLKAIDVVSLAIRKGEIAGFIGPNGAGKSTLINCIAGIVSQSAGRVTFDGVDVSALASARLAQSGIARTFQNLELFHSMTVRDNVLVAVETHRRFARSAAVTSRKSKRTNRAIDLKAADRAIEQFELGADRMKPVVGLSYAKRKMVELARVFAVERKLILLDEPMAGVALEERAEVMEVLRSNLRRNETAVIIVEHDMNVIKTLCETVHVLDSGKLIASGTFESVMLNSQVRSAYLGLDPSET